MGEKLRITYHYFCYYIGSRLELWLLKVLQHPLSKRKLLLREMWDMREKYRWCQKELKQPCTEQTR